MKDTDTIRLSPEMEAELHALLVRLDKLAKLRQAKRAAREVLQIELDPLTIDRMLTSGELPT